MVSFGGVFFGLMFYMIPRAGPTKSLLQAITVHSISMFSGFFGAITILSRNCIVVYYYIIIWRSLGRLIYGENVCFFWNGFFFQFHWFSELPIGWVFQDMLYYVLINRYYY